MAPEDFVGREIGFLESNDDFAELMRQFFAAPKGQISQEIAIAVGGQLRSYLVAAQKYDLDRSAVAVGIDISDRIKVELELTLSQERLQFLLSSSPGILYSRRPLTPYRTTFISNNVSSMLGYDAQHFLEATSFWASHIHPEDASDVFANLPQLFEQGYRNYEYRFRHKDGTYRWIYDQSKLVRDEAGKPLEIIGYWADISDRKQTEAKLQASLEEKEVLIREVHHRVKNNLHVITNLLDMESDYIEDEGVKTILLESQNRIYAMARVHQQLCQSDNLARVNLAEYIDNLVEKLLVVHNANPGHIQVVLKLEPVTVNLETAIPCGLLINELVTNSLKYAFPEGQLGEILIQLHSGQQQKLNLIIGDNGIGIPEEVDWRQTNTLGLKLAEILARQLKAAIELDRSKGTCFRLAFSELQYKPRF